MAQTTLQRCTDSFNDSLRNVSVFLHGRSSNATQFCSDFDQIVPVVYFAFSLLSAVSCLWVVATYKLFPRLSGYSSRVFLIR